MNKHGHAARAPGWQRAAFGGRPPLCRPSARGGFSRGAAGTARPPRCAYRTAGRRSRGAAGRRNRQDEQVVVRHQHDGPHWQCSVSHRAPPGLWAFDCRGVSNGSPMPDLPPTENRQAVCRPVGKFEWHGSSAPSNPPGLLISPPAGSPAEGRAMTPRELTDLLLFPEAAAEIRRGHRNDPAPERPGRGPGRVDLRHDGPLGGPLQPGRPAAVFRAGGY